MTLSTEPCRNCMGHAVSVVFWYRWGQEPMLDLSAQMGPRFLAIGNAWGASCSARGQTWPGDGSLGASCYARGQTWAVVHVCFAFALACCLLVRSMDDVWMM